MVLVGIAFVAQEKLLVNIITVTAQPHSWMWAVLQESESKQEKIVAVPNAFQLMVL